MEFELLFGKTGDNQEKKLGKSLEGCCVFSCIVSLPRIL